MASRILGFARDTLVAASLGAGPLADAFVVAFRLPNLFRRLFAEGAFNSAFVPLYARKLESEGAAGAGQFAGQVFSGLLAILLAFSAVAMLFAPVLVSVLAPGYGDEAEKFDLTVELSIICFPYLTAVSLTALLSGILNAHRRFFVAAFAPVVLNVISVAALGGVMMAGLAQTRTAALVLCWSISAAGLAQLAMVARACARSPGAFRPGRPRWTGDMARLIRLGVPGAIAAGATQINIVIGTMIASTLAGANSYLYFADRIYQLPLGVVGVAVGVVLLPEVARQIRAGQNDQALHQQNRALEFAMVLTLPAAAALMLLAQPIVSVLFERGAFRPQDTAQTALALACFGAGLPAFVMAKVFGAGFFAREDTRTPMLYGLAAMAVNIIGSALTWWFAPASVHVGIAVSTSLGGWLTVVLSYRRLTGSGGWRGDASLKRRLPRIVAAALAMGALVHGLSLLALPYLTVGNSTLTRFGALALICGSGLIAYFLFCQLTGGIDLRQMRQQLRRRTDVGPSGPIEA